MQTDREKSVYVRDMFSRIAGNYDLLNRLMTAGQDVRWRKELIANCDLQPGDRVLDLGTGTGDLALEAIQECSSLQAIGGDFTLQMMQAGKSNSAKKDIQWLACDATELPFENQQFEVVVSGFLLRNVNDLQLALKEQFRVLKPGGRIAALDTTHPPEGLISPITNFYLNHVIPSLGSLISGDKEAYQYLPQSTSQFLRAEELSNRFAQVGFTNIKYVKKMMGTVAIHWAQKPMGG